VTDPEDQLPAGPFGPWLAGVRRALDDGVASEVPCGSCSACCTSSQFVHVEPDELDALRHIPAKLLFPAPRLPHGHVLLGYDERGHCPMLVDGRCSIYDHRPRTCRTYDCRVFPATGVEPDEESQPAIAAQARRWRFDVDDEVAHAATRAAARFVADHPERLPAGAVPVTPTQHAVVAIRLQPAFVQQGAGERGGVVEDPDPAAVRAALAGQRAGRRRGGAGSSAAAKTAATSGP
jgi:uncharacterized protein